MDKELEKAIVSVLIGEKKVLTAKQQQIDVHEPEKDELTAKDFEMLRAGKKAKQVKEEQVDEAVPLVAAAARAAASPTGKKVISAVAQHAAMKAVDKAAEKFSNNEETELDEAGMPSSVARHKQNLKNMSDKEFANHPHYGKMDDKQLRSMAWSHGYGGPGTRGHDTYVDKKKRGLQTEETYRGESGTVVGPDKEGKKQLQRDMEARKKNTELVHSLAAEIRKKKEMGEEVEQVDEISAGLATSAAKARISRLGKPTTQKDVNVMKQGGGNPYERADKAVQRAGARGASKNTVSGLKGAVTSKFNQSVAAAKAKRAGQANEETAYSFNDYLNAAREKFGDDDAVRIANEAYNNNDTSLFSND